MPDVVREDLFPHLEVFSHLEIVSLKSDHRMCPCNEGRFIFLTWRCYFGSLITRCALWNKGRFNFHTWRFTILVLTDLHPISWRLKTIHHFRYVHKRSIIYLKASKTHEKVFHLVKVITQTFTRLIQLFRQQLRHFFVNLTNMSRVMYYFRRRLEITMCGIFY